MKKKKDLKTLKMKNKKKYPDGKAQSPRFMLLYLYMCI